MDDYAGDVGFYSLLKGQRTERYDNILMLLGHQTSKPWRTLGDADHGRQFYAESSHRILILSEWGKIVMTTWQGFYSTSQVSRLARIPRSTLYDWKARNILKPSVRIMSGNEVVDEGYSYADLTILRLTRAIRDKKLNMRSVCIALRHLIDRFGHPTNQEWSGVHVYIANNHVYAEKLDEWDVTAADRGGQKVETRLFDYVFNILRDMDEDGDILLPKGFSQCITIRPGVMGGDPVIKNTRIPTASIATKFHQGTSVNRLADLYQPVTRQCIEKAIEYEKYLDSPIAQAGEVVAGRRY